MLTFNLKKKWFEKIKSGKKTHEYREVNPYWNCRLSNILHNCIIKKEAFSGEVIAYPHNETICLKCGYPKNNETEKIMYAKVLSIKQVPGWDTDLKIYNKVFDIEFKLLESEK